MRRPPTKDVTVFQRVTRHASRVLHGHESVKCRCNTSVVVRMWRFRRRSSRLFCTPAQGRNVRSVPLGFVGFGYAPVSSATAVVPSGNPRPCTCVLQMICACEHNNHGENARNPGTVEYVASVFGW